jgi:hypothetical protein
MLGVARLDVHAFEDIEADHSATIQALLVVVLVAIASGIGFLGGGLTGLAFGIIGSLVRWAIWALITLVIGTTIFKTPQTHADWGQMARVTGFAQTPGLLMFLGFVPLVGGVIVFAIIIWQAIAMVIGVRQALDYQSTLRAVGVVVVGFIFVVIVTIILDRLSGGALTGIQSTSGTF